MIEISTKDIAQATSGECIEGSQDAPVIGVSTDTRTLHRGMLFIALEGERFDGHDFLNEAIEAGCSALMVSKETGSAMALAANRGVSVIRVPDTQIALQDLAAYYLSRFSLIKIGVTGSTGKTTTKEMLYWILSERYRTVRNAGNFNNLIGVPLSAFQIGKDTEVAIFEMGMDRLGEIHRLAEIVRPNVGIITNIGLSHIQHLGSQENIRNAKMEIADFFSVGDTLIINSDNEMLKSGTYTGDYSLITVGRLDNSMIQILESEDLGEEGIRFTLAGKGEKEVFYLTTPGLHNAANAALAVALAMELGMTMKEAARGLAKLAYTDKRLHIVVSQGIKIIDDTYNASPDSMRAAIDVLISVQGKRKIAILGDMFELGSQEEEYHYQVGEYASMAGVDVIISVGKNAKQIDLGARAGGAKSIHFDTKDLLIGVLAQWIRPGDVVLVKGSRGMAMDEIVKQLDKESDKE
jgi:UDP-N-acetylmuramoyl-tripeptide--D-alanyl-D-alanine ligase